MLIGHFLKVLPQEFKFAYRRKRICAIPKEKEKPAEPIDPAGLPDGQG